jgi:hypothetical protein
MMKKLLVATVMATVLATSTAAFAFAPMKVVEGNIQSVAPDGKTVTLVNGPTFTASPSLSTEPLQAGEQVTIAYQQKGGQKEMTAFWIDSSNSGR